MSVIGERLKQARELSGYTQGQLAEMLGVTQSTVALLERDALVPRSELVDAIAAKMSFPKDFFDLPVERDVPLGSLVYRKNARMKAEHKRLSHRLAQQAYELSEFFAGQLKPIPVALPRAVDVDAASAARLVRNALGVDPDAPIKNLLHRIERLGVRVFMLPDDVPDLDAFSTIVAGRHPMIVLNPARTGDRQAFSLAHELGHLVMHYPLTAGQDEIEHEADVFAGELLLPEEAIRAELTAPVTLSLLAELKSRWRVSIGALLQRAKGLDIVTLRQYKYLRMQMAQAGWVKHEPVEIPADRPRGFMKMAEVVYGGTPNAHRIARDTKRPTFLVARLLAVAPSDSAGRLLDFRSDTKKEASELAEA